MGAARQPEEQYIYTQLVTQKIPRARATMMARKKNTAPAKIAEMKLYKNIVDTIQKKKALPLHIPQYFPPRFLAYTYYHTKRGMPRFPHPKKGGKGNGSERRGGEERKKTERVVLYEPRESLLRLRLQGKENEK